MKGPFILAFFLVIFQASSAQVHVDSLMRTADVVGGNIDSLKAIFHLPGSLPSVYRKIDSLQSKFKLAADSAQGEYRNTVSKIDKQTTKLNRSIDSLSRLDLPTNLHSNKLDSLNGLRITAENKLKSTLNTLKSKTTEKLNAIEVPSQYKEQIDKLTKNITALDIDTDFARLPAMNLHDYSIPEMDDFSKLSIKTTDIGNVGELGNIPKIEAPSGDLANISEQAKAYQDDIKEIADGNLADVNKLPGAIEKRAADIEGMDELQKQSAMIDGQKTALQELSDPQKGKEKAVAMAKKAAVNHFAGKQDQLKAAMEKISKYKQKFSSVSSIKDLPKRPPNAMKGKRFIERVVPGLYLQYQQKEFYLVDVNPYLGYRVSGRLTAGLGWNHRYAYDKKIRRLQSRSRIFGPRAYADFRLGKGFIAHIEGESMNSFVPSTLRGNPDTGNREWVWSFMTGLKKEYKIYRNLKGTALIQYNLFNRYYKAPYVDRLNSRIGFEYVVKSKRKKK